MGTSKLTWVKQGVPFSAESGFVDSMAMTVSWLTSSILLLNKRRLLKTLEHFNLLARPFKRERLSSSAASDSDSLVCQSSYRKVRSSAFGLLRSWSPHKKKSGQ